MAIHDAHVYEPRSGHGLAHDPFNSIVAPRPIGWISSIDMQGRHNLAPYSFFNALNYTPPIVGFSSVTWKHSVANIEATGGFCWNLATRDLAGAMNASSASVAEGVDEFALAGVTATASRHVAAPMVLESPVNFECRLIRIIRLTDADGDALESWLVLGEVVCVHIERRLLVDGTYDTIAADPILRGGGPGDYFQVTRDTRFVMKRPA